MGNESEIGRRVRRVISESLCVDVETTKSEANLVADLSADSLDTVELSMALEEEFGIEISDSEMFGMRTVEDVIALVRRLSKR